MGVIIPPGFGQVRLVWETAGLTRPMVVTHGIAAVGLEATDVADDIYTDVTGAGGIAEAAFMSSQYTFKGVTVTVMKNLGPFIGEHLADVVGTGSIDSMPPNCAVLIRKSTGLGGRRGRGRMFVPPYNPAESVVGPSGTIATTPLGLLQTRWGQYLSFLSGASMPMQLLHSQPGFEPVEVTALSVQSRVATQRRRLRQ